MVGAPASATQFSIRRFGNDRFWTSEPHHRNGNPRHRRPSIKNHRLIVSPCRRADVATNGRSYAVNQKFQAFPPDPRVDKYFDRWDRPDSPGACVAVAKAGTIVYSRGYGAADLDHDIPNTPATVFHAASLAKQFTAMCIMLLVNRGVLNLADE